MATILLSNYRSDDQIEDAFTQIAEDIQLRAIKLGNASIGPENLSDSADELMLSAEQEFLKKVKDIVKKDSIYERIFVQDLTDEFFTYNTQQHLMKLLQNKSVEVISLR